MSAKISIVTPVLNRADFLEDTILSVISQNYSNLEYIIIDGGSTDGTLDIIKKFEKHISYWISEPDKGIYHAIQKGFEHSSGDIMAWLNSDDLYRPDALNMVASIFNDTEVEWITGMGAIYNINGYCVKSNNIAKWSKSRIWLKDYKWIQQENVFWKRSLWEKAGQKIDMSYKFAGDFELWCRFFKYAELYSVFTSFAGFRLHGEQISIGFRNEYEMEALDIAKKFKPSKSDEKFRFLFLLILKNLRKVIKITMLLFFMEPLVLKVMERLHAFPKVIRYNFTELKWEIAIKKSM